MTTLKKAGPELDEIIATKVMGLYKERGFGFWPNDLVTWREPGGLRVSDESPPRYSTEMGDAWTLVEQTRKRLFWSIEMGFNPGWVITIGVKGDKSKDFRMQACESAPLAICLAVMEAFERVGELVGTNPEES